MPKRKWSNQFYLDRPLSQITHLKKERSESDQGFSKRYGGYPIGILVCQFYFQQFILMSVYVCVFACRHTRTGMFVFSI